MSYRPDDERNMAFLIQQEARRRLANALLNMKLNTVLYRPPSWYWRDWIDDEIKKGGVKE